MNHHPSTLPQATFFDLIVVGATPGGLATAISAARFGHRVALMEDHDHVGGMAASGLGKSDVENRWAIGGIFKEFTQRVLNHYRRTYGHPSTEVALCRDGYYYEPSVAETVFRDMLADAGNITLLTGHRLLRATTQNHTLRAIDVIDRSTGMARHFNARLFADATYEGDLYAAAGARFHLGRESRDTWNEPHAGHIYYDYENGVILPGSTGAGDHRLPAYTYRLCLTTDPANSVPLTAPPAGYDRTRYTGYLDDLASGRLSAPAVFKDGWGYYPEHFDTPLRALSVTELPNHKVDANINPRPLSFPFAEENEGYLDGGWAARERIAQHHRDLVLGLLWFLQNDEAISPQHRSMAQRYQLPRDEFTDNGHFPFQLYIREGRRLAGLHTLTEHDIAITDKPREFHPYPDTIAMGEFPIDSFPVRKRQPGDTVVLEGYLGMLAHLTRPYTIPYRILIPERLDGLIVPVAASTTHVAFSSVRMEPTWMTLGQAAGVATHIALQRNVSFRNVPVAELQQLLQSQGAILAPRLTAAA